MLLTWREAPKMFRVFISGAKRRKIFEAYLCCNRENCLTPLYFSAKKYWEIVHTPFMRGRFKRYLLVYKFL